MKISSFLITFLRVSSAFINLELPKTADILGKKVLDSATALTRGMVVAGDFGSKALATFGDGVGSRVVESATELKRGLVIAGENFGIKAVAHLGGSIETSVGKLADLSKV